jgi:hypothetical protein
MACVHITMRGESGGLTCDGARSGGKIKARERRSRYGPVPVRDH